MTLEISARQRDLLYEQILDRMTGVGDIWLAVAAGDFDAAERLGREFCDDFALISTDLGWGEGSGGAIELTTPPDILRRALSRHCDLALMREAREKTERRELNAAKEDNDLLVQVCHRLMTALARSERVAP